MQVDSLQSELPETEPQRHREVVYIRTMEYYSIIKKNEILPPTVTWTSLEGIMLSEMIQEGQTKHCMISLICEI